MADRPIIFSAPMIKALLAGRKTQTRRILKPRPDARTTHVSVCRDVWMGCGPSVTGGTSQWDAWTKLPFVVGDRLYVREGHYLTDDGYSEHAVYAADEEEVKKHLAAIAALPASFPEKVRRAHLKLRPSIHMPRWASRVTLLVTDVAVERLQDISEADAVAEGVEHESADPPFYYVPGVWPHSITAVGVEEPGGRHAARSFAKLWGHINWPESWQANPWVVVVSFAVVVRNIDDLPVPLAPVDALEIAGALS